MQSIEVLLNFFLKGMKPYVYSMKKMGLFGTGWQQSGEKIDYRPRKLLYEDVLNNFFT